MERLTKCLMVRAMAAPLALAGMGAAYADGVFNGVTPSRYDPGHSSLVQAKWLSGTGCPTGAKVSTGTGT